MENIELKPGTLSDSERESFLKALQEHSNSPAILVPSREWISVKERVPEYDDNFSQEFAIICGNGAKVIGRIILPGDTHWMPLPQTPKSE